METFGARIKLVRNFLKLTQSEFANLLDTTSTSIIRYEKDEALPSFAFLLKVKDQHPEIDLNWLLAGVNSMFVSNNLNCPRSTNQLITSAISVADRSAAYYLLDGKIEEFIVQQTFREKFTFPQSAALFGAVFEHFERLKLLRLFARSMRDARDKIENLTPANGKSILKNVILSYEFSFADKYDNFIGEKHRKFLLGLVEEFNDVECFAILSDIDRAIEILEDEKLTVIDRFHIPILSSTVKL